MPRKYYGMNDTKFISQLKELGLDDKDVAKAFIHLWQNGNIMPKILADKMNIHEKKASQLLESLEDKGFAECDFNDFPLFYSRIPIDEIDNHINKIIISKSPVSTFTGWRGFLYFMEEALWKNIGKE